MKEVYDIIITKDKEYSIFSRYQLSNILKYIGIKESIAMELAKEANKIILNEKDFSYLDDNLKPILEPGTFEIMIGSSSEDIRLKGSLVINNK